MVPAIRPLTIWSNRFHRVTLTLIQGWGPRVYQSCEPATGAGRRPELVSHAQDFPKLKFLQRQSVRWKRKVGRRGQRARQGPDPLLGLLRSAAERRALCLGFLCTQNSVTAGWRVKGNGPRLETEFDDLMKVKQELMRN